MRKILFRARVLNTAEWVEGDLQQGIDGTKIIIGKESFRVDPETVCEYTGAIDINGRMIFENDIVTYKKHTMYQVKFEDSSFSLHCIGLELFPLYLGMCSVTDLEVVALKVNAGIVGIR